MCTALRWQSPSPPPPTPQTTLPQHSFRYICMLHAKSLAVQATSISFIFSQINKIKCNSQLIVNLPGKCERPAPSLTSATILPVGSSLISRLLAVVTSRWPTFAGVKATCTAVSTDSRGSPGFRLVTSIRINWKKLDGWKQKCRMWVFVCSAAGSLILIPNTNLWERKKGVPASGTVTHERQEF